MTDAREVLVIRADADTRMGTGHVMRCVALAQAWEERGGRAQFVCSTVTPSLEARLRGEGFSVTSLPESAGSLADAAATVEVARHAGASWIVVDGYHFDVAYHRAIKTAGLRLLILDDYGHADRYLADLVLNQNVHAGPSLYRDREPHTRLLLGTRYAMLRREFWASRLWRQSIPPVARRLLVTLGGSDPDNVTRTLIEAIAGLNVDGLQTTVLVGGSNPHQASLDAAVRGSSRPIRIERNVSNMPPWMQWADAAVTAAGGTLWELAFLLCRASPLFWPITRSRPHAGWPIAACFPRSVAGRRCPRRPSTDLCVGCLGMASFAESTVNSRRRWSTETGCSASLKRCRSDGHRGTHGR